MSNFEISDTVVKDSVATTVHIWNRGFQNIKGLAQGDDWSTFFKVKVVVSSSFFFKKGVKGDVREKCEKNKIIWKSEF